MKSLLWKVWENYIFFWTARMFDFRSNASFSSYLSQLIPQVYYAILWCSICLILRWGRLKSIQSHLLIRSYYFSLLHFFLNESTCTKFNRNRLWNLMMGRIEKRLIGVRKQTPSIATWISVKHFLLSFIVTLILWGRQKTNYDRQYKSKILWFISFYPSPSHVK